MQRFCRSRERDTLGDYQISSRDRKSSGRLLSDGAACGIVDDILPLSQSRARVTRIPASSCRLRSSACSILRIIGSNVAQLRSHLRLTE